MVLPAHSSTEPGTCIRGNDVVELFDKYINMTVNIQSRYRSGARRGHSHAPNHPQIARRVRKFAEAARIFFPFSPFTFHDF